MFKWLPAPIKGIFNWLYLILGTLFWCIPMYVFFILKYLLPFKAWREFWSDRLHSIGHNWALSTKFIINKTQNLELDIQGMPELAHDKWYFIAANHQSWTDIMILTHVFSGKMPFIKYFVKDTLKFFPLIGIAWWAFEFPMMKRHSNKKLAKNPQLRGQDIETTLTLCKKYLRKPSSILSFVEGTRFTPKKHQKQQSPFKHMLKPKPGGVALTIKALKDHIDSLIHVTLVYPENNKSFWQFMSGKIKKVTVIIEQVPIPEQFKEGDYANDPVFRQEIKDWLYNIWGKTDQKIEQLRLENA